MNNPKVKPALIAGIVFGALAVVPIVSYVNALCCALYIGGGVLAVYLYLKDIPRPDARPSGDGAVLGVLTGLFGAVAQTVVGTLLRAMGVGEEQVQTARQQLAEAGVELPPLAMDLLGMSGLSVGSVLIGLVGSAILFVIFGAIGGLIGVSIFYKKDGV